MEHDTYLQDVGKRSVSGAMTMHVSIHTHIHVHKKLLKIDFVKFNSKHLDTHTHTVAPFVAFAGSARGVSHPPTHLANTQ